MRDPWACRCAPIVYIGRCPSGEYIKRVIHTLARCKAVEELDHREPDPAGCADPACDVPFADETGLCPLHTGAAPRSTA